MCLFFPGAPFGGFLVWVASKAFSIMFSLAKKVHVASTAIGGCSSLRKPLCQLRDLWLRRRRRHHHRAIAVAAMARKGRVLRMLYDYQSPTLLRGHSLNKTQITRSSDPASKLSCWRASHDWNSVIFSVFNWISWSVFNWVSSSSFHISRLFL